MTPPKEYEQAWAEEPGAPAAETNQPIVQAVAAAAAATPPGDAKAAADAKTEEEAKTAGAKPNASPRRTAREAEDKAYADAFNEEDKK